MPNCEYCGAPIPPYYPTNPYQPNKGFCSNACESAGNAAADAAKQDIDERLYDTGTWGADIREFLLDEILDERANQDKKWGIQNHTPLEWLPILVEEVGEMAQALCNAYFGSPESYQEMRHELVQVAAVALAMLECCERNQWVSKLTKKEDQ